MHQDTNMAAMRAQNAAAEVRRLSSTILSFTKMLDKLEETHSLKEKGKGKDKWPSQEP